MNDEIKYATFGDRFAAYILDTLIVGLPTFALNWANFSVLKSFYLYLLLTILGMLYKPLMESRYQATVGKMMMNLKVTDKNFNPIDFEKSLLRSIIYLLPTFAYIPASYLAFQDASLMQIDNYWGFSQAISNTFPALQILNCFLSIIILVDLIVFLTDDLKQGRSLKDRIAKTFVIKNA